MALITLGRLELAGQVFPQRQALLLLAYLNAEGQKERSFLAELFWPEAKRPLNNLSSAMTRIRSVDGDLISGDRYTVSTIVPSDADRFLEYVGVGRHLDALDLYRGRFLDGFALNRLGLELQEWILDRRAELAAAARDCARELAVDHLRQGRTDAALSAAERSLALGADAIPDPETLGVLHSIFTPANHPSAARVRTEASEIGLQLENDGPGSSRPAPQSAPAIRPIGVDRPFFGRESELDDLERGLEGKRVAAITGLGGVGKSRLAAAVLDRLGGRLGATHWVDGAGVDSVGLLPEVLSLALFPDQEPASTVQELATSIGDRRLVMVLDAADRMADRLGVLEPLVGGCPNLVLIITARSEVGLDVGTHVRLTGLPVTAVDGRPAGPAIQLFRVWFERRAPIGSTLDLNDPAVAEICDHLQGLPLAIELAASWLTVLTPREIADELVGGPSESGFLQDAEQAMAPHHSDLDAVMGGTWELLDDQCRAAAARLSVFPSGFDRTAAEVVSLCSVMTLRRLASWSIVARADGAHYRCHPLVRSFARQRLADDPDQEYEARWAHARYLLSLVSETKTVEEFEATDVLGSVEDPIGNLLTVWRFLVEEMDIDELAVLADPLDRVLSRFGRHRTLLDVWQQTSDQLRDRRAPDSIMDRLIMHQVWLHLRLGDYERSTTLADRLLGPSRRATGPAVEPDIFCEVTRARAAIDRTEGDVDRALARLEQARPVAGRVSPRMRALIDDDIGLCQMILGLYPESRESYRAVLDWARAGGSQPMIARTLLSLGTGHHDAGEPIESLGYLLEAKSVVAVHGLTHLEPNVDAKLAGAHLANGNVEAARALVGAAGQRGDRELEPWLTVEFDLLSARLAAADGAIDAMWERLQAGLTTAVDLSDVPFMAKAYMTMVEVGSALPGMDDAASGAAVLLAAVADRRSGADAPDRNRARRLLEKSDRGEHATSPAAGDIIAVAPDAFAYVRRGRALTAGTPRP